MRRDMGRLSSARFDLLIVGGGIYGACAAWEGTLRGLSVALIEQRDFGGATSANTQKIVHGGLRYLQSLDLARMRESIRERRSLMRIAPHLVRPLPFLMPTYGRGMRSRPVMAVACVVNDLIAWDRNRGLDDPQQRIPRCRTISKEECLRLMPGIPEQGLTGGTIWYDAQMQNPERLTLAFLLSAAERGAAVANYVDVVGLLRNGGRLRGVQARDTTSGRSFEIQARIVLNASGPWIDQVLGRFNAGRPRTPFVKAMNLLTRPLTKGLALGVPSQQDGRFNTGLLFITPWQDRSIIGTRYAVYDGNPADCHASDEEIQRFLDEVNRAYPPAQLRRDDVVFVHVGLLPAAPRQASGPITRLAQRPCVVDHARTDGIEGLISVLGVKYTTARDVAEKAVDLVCARLDKNTPRGLSRTTPLVGGGIERMDMFLKEALQDRLWGLSPLVIRHLAHSYGSRFPDVLRLVRENLTWCETIDGSAPVIKAEAIYAVRHEMAMRLSDVIFRRTELGTLGHPGSEALAVCADLMAVELGWNDARIAHEIEDTEAHFARMGVRRTPDERTTASSSCLEALR